MTLVPSVPDRGEQMAARVRRTLEHAGLSDAQMAPILATHERAMERRRRLLADDHHPAFLHPGRTVIVAVTDAGIGDPELLRLAPLMDSLFPEMAPDDEGVLDALHPLPLSGIRGPVGEPADAPGVRSDEPMAPGAESGAAASRRSASPRAESHETLIEHLATLDLEPLALVLSESLDHLRHLHLSDDRALQLRVAERTQAVLLPLAGRMGGTLDRRYRWWWRRVGLGLLAL